MSFSTATLPVLVLAAALVAGCASAPARPPAPEAPEPAPTPGPAAEAPAPIELVTLPSPESPIVAVRLLFRAGSIYDPEGKEGLAALTALMLGAAGSEERSYSELVDALYPLAASIDVLTDREVSVLSAEVHRETLAGFTDLLVEVLTRPGLAASDFSRNRKQLEAYLKNTLRASNDELLGLEALQGAIFAGHPYGHPPEGTIGGLAAVNLSDVESFYRERFTSGSLMLGVAGGYPEGYPERLAARLAALPAGEAPQLELPAPMPVEGRRFVLLDKPTSSVGIHFGFPLPLNRADEDYYPLMVANSFLGEHRTFHGRLMQQLRGKRGLNYGDYSYIEYWHQPPFTSTPSPGVPRRQQYFSVWVRPVVPETAHFALRNAIYEVERLAARGLTADEFDLTRSFLVNYSKLWAQSVADRLGFLMDSRYYGMDYYIDEIDRRLSEMTVAEVNEAVRRYLDPDDFIAVLVTDEAATLEARLTAGEPSPMEYNSPPEQEVVAADKTIQELEVGPTSFVILPVDEMFAGGGAQRSGAAP